MPSAEPGRSLTLAAALREAEQHIGRIDARALLCHVTGRDPAYLIAHADDRLSDGARLRYDALVARRQRGEPVAYLTGEREFFGRSFKVTPAVLVPRHETEILVEAVLERVPAESAARVLDLGTGSGCLAVTIALERPRAMVVAADRADDALTVARENAANLGARSVTVVSSDWYSALAGQRFHVIVANPPYVARGDPHLAEGDLRYEPAHALEGGSDGLECIRSIVAGAATHLSEGGWLILEHAHDQAEAVRALLAPPYWRDTFTWRDLAGIQRVTGARVAALRAPR